MQPGTPPDYDAFRQEVREFLSKHLTSSVREKAARQAGMFAEPELGLWWHRKLYEIGWVAPAWPREYGGPGWDVVQRHIFESECFKEGAPAIAAMGLQLCGPVLMKYGTDEQKQFFLPKILSGEHYWCQGFSEPQSGSDLASLQTRAVRDGDDYVLNGSKIWTTHAHYANWIFILARTSTEGKPQAGISFLLSPVNVPGISLQPIISMSGEHEQNQVFFDNLRVPVKNRVGKENQGWEITKYLLEFERGGTYAAQIQGLLEEAKTIARAQESGDGGSVWDDPFFRRRISSLEIEARALAATEQRIISSLSAGGNVGDTIASILKLTGTDLLQKATEICVEALGTYALPDQRPSLEPGSNIPPVGPDYAAKPLAKYLYMRASTIYGGSSEIQHNIISRAGLGL